MKTIVYFYYCRCVFIKYTLLSLCTNYFIAVDHDDISIVSDTAISNKNTKPTSVRSKFTLWAASQKIR